MNSGATPSVRGAAGIFVGRERELQQLTAALENAVQDSAQIVLVSGEAGIGKTRLLGELAKLATQRGARVLWGTCAEEDAGRAYGPFLEALEGHVRSAEATALESLLGPTAGVIARLVPLVHDRLPEVATPVGLQPDEERTRLFDAVSAVLMALTKQTPLVLVLDDLHWAEPDTVALLRHVARTTQGLLFVGAYRSAEVDDQGAFAETLAVLRRLPSFESLRLNGLGSEDVEALFAALAERTPSEHAGPVAPALVAAILAHTRGNPFFVRSLVQHLVEEGALRCDTDGWRAVVPLDEIGIPEGVRELVSRRLKRLTEEARRFLTAGAAMGTTFSFQVAARVAELTEEHALTVVDETFGAQFIEAAPLLDTYRFSHALVRQTLYEALNPSRQVRLHRRIAEAMPEVYGERADEHAGEIARHYERSASLTGAERGVAYALVAADGAEAAYAHDDAVTFLRAALTLLPQSDTRRPRLLSRLGVKLVWALNFDAAPPVILEAAELIAATEGPAAAADYLAEAAMDLWGAGHQRGAWALASRGLGYAGDRRDITWVRLKANDVMRREAEDPEFPGIMVDSPERRAVVEITERMSFSRSEGIFLGSSGFVAAKSRQDILDRFADVGFWMMQAGEYRRSLSQWEALIAQSEREGRIADTVAYCCQLARCHNALGNSAAARAAHKRGAALSGRVSGWFFQTMTLASARYEMQCVVDEGWEDFFVDVEASQSATIENPWGLAGAQAVAAHLLARLGQADQALLFVATLLPALQRAPTGTITYAIVACNAAMALWLLGRTDHIEVIEHNLRDKVVTPGFCWPMVDGRLSMAHLCALQGRYDEALDWFAKARVVLDEQGARPLRAITDFDEALMCHRRGAAGDGDRARPLLDAALKQFRAIGMPGWIRRAEELLEETHPPNPILSGREGGAGEGDRSSEFSLSSQERRPGGEFAQLKPAPSARAAFLANGHFWTITYDGVSVQLKHARGLTLLAELLRQPGREIAATELGGRGRPGTQTRGAALDRETAMASGLGDAGELLDEQARTTYQQRVVEIRAELEEAQEFNDNGRSERLRAELEFVTAELSRAVGIGGRERRAGSHAERARISVTRAIDRALHTIAKHHPALGEHFARTIKTGTFCSYSPDPRVPIEWQL